MSSKVDNVDIVVGLCWGDEAKGKITASLAKSKNYNLVARWAGGNNAGHTVFLNGDKYKTHLIPSGIFYGIPSLIGPGCVLHPESFKQELKYLEFHGFDINLIKVHPNCHIVLDEHIEFDKETLAAKLGTTSKGIAPAYASKAARTGLQAKEFLSEEFLWRSELSGNILCEGAQGVWLDIDHGNYPYVTSSTTLPYGACSLGFAPQKIRNIFGAAKIYDTRSGEDPLFPSSLLEDPYLGKICLEGQEYGVTTGRKRKVNWLNLDKLITSINLTGTTFVVISKADVLEKLGNEDAKFFKLYSGELFHQFYSFSSLVQFIETRIESECPLVKDVQFSYSPEGI